MPALKNARQERFAQGLAKGATADAAYADAGYKPDRGAASRLSAKVSIRDRVAELQERAAIRTEVTIQSIADQLDADRQLAHSVGQAGPAVSASLGKAKLFGLIVDRAKVDATATMVTEMVDRPPRETREQWIARVSAERGIPVAGRRGVDS